MTQEERTRFETQRAALVAKLAAQTDWPYSFPRPTVESLTEGTARFHGRMAEHLEKKGDTVRAARARKSASAARG